MLPFINPMMLGGKSKFNPATPLGTAIEGGYYLGSIVDGGQTWALIVSPISSGDNTGVAWKTSNTSTSGTASVTNGLDNSNAMNDAGHPAAFWACGLTIAGYTDWYLPAKNELNVVYLNRSSLPVGERLIATGTGIIYWTSTETNATSAWGQTFFNGTQNSPLKSNSFRARAVRRVLIG